MAPAQCQFGGSSVPVLCQFGGSLWHTFQKGPGPAQFPLPNVCLTETHDCSSLDHGPRALCLVSNTQDAPRSPSRLVLLSSWPRPLSPRLASPVAFRRPPSVRAMHLRHSRRAHNACPPFACPFARQEHAIVTIYDAIMTLAAEWQGCQGLSLELQLSPQRAWGTLTPRASRLRKRRSRPRRPCLTCTDPLPPNFFSPSFPC